MSERSNEPGGLKPGDPLNPGGSEPPPHESGLPDVPREPVRPDAPSGGLWSSPEAPPSPPASPGYYGPSSPPPPGAGGAVPAGRPAFSGQLVLAGWWRRVGAALIDGLIIGVVALAIMAPFGIGFFATDNTNDSGFVALAVGFIVAILVFAVVALLYAPVMMAKTNGKTLGRMATGIRVVRANGQRMTFGVAAIREIVLKALVVGIANSFLFGLPGLIDVLWPLWDEENRALHDFPVNTRTILD